MRTRPSRSWGSELNSDSITSSHYQKILSMIVLGLFLSLMLGVASSSSISGRQDVPGNPVFVQATHSGNGCPQGNTTTIYGNWKTATIHFNSFASDSQMPSTRSKNCQVHLTGKDAPVGYQVGLTEVEYWGDLSLKDESTFTWYGTQFRSEDAANTVCVFYFC